MTLGGKGRGDKLRMAREAAKLSRERAARALDPPISMKTLERWEGGANVKRFRLEQLAKIYGVPVESLNNGKAG